MDRGVTVITVAIPTLGSRPAYLQATIASIRSQSMGCRIVAVAPTSVMPKLRDIAVDHLVACDEPGIGAAVNAGWHAVPSQMVSWLGDDDLLMPFSLEHASSALVRTGKSAVYGDCQIIDENGNYLHRIRPSRFGICLARIGPNIVPQPGALFDFEVIERVGWLDESLRYSMDLDLFLRIRRNGQLCYVPEVLAAFRRHPGSLTVQKLNPYEETRLVQRRYLGTLGRSLHGRTARLSALTGKLLNRYYEWRYPA